jgi:hypothetical protein
MEPRTVPVIRSLWALLAAVITAPLTRGRAGLKELGLRIIRWRVRWYWYAFAIGLPLAIHGLAVEAGAALVRPTRRGTWIAVDHLGRLLGYKSDYFVGANHTMMVNVPTSGARTVYVLIVLTSAETCVHRVVHITATYRYWLPPGVCTSKHPEDEPAGFLICRDPTPGPATPGHLCRPGTDRGRVLITAGVTARRWAMRSWHGGLGSAMSGDEITQGRTVKVVSWFAPVAGRRSDPSPPAQFAGPAQQDQRNCQHDQTQDDQRYPPRGVIDDDVHAHDRGQRGDR